MYLATQTPPACGGATTTGGMTVGITGRGSATGGGAISSGASMGCESPAG